MTAQNVTTTEIMLSPVAEQDALRARFIPQDGEQLSEDEFLQRGAVLLEIKNVADVLLAELLDWKFRQEMANTDESRWKVLLRYAGPWGVSASSLWRTWVATCMWPELSRPQDVPPTLTYEVLSGCQDQDEAEQVFDKALGEGWTVEDVRMTKALRAQGFLDDWRRLRLVSDGQTISVVDGDGQRAPVATLRNDGPLSRAGVALLRMRSRV